MTESVQSNEKYTNILGVKLSAVNMTMALHTIDEWIRRQQANYVCVAPVHSIMECFDSPELRDVFNHAGLVTPDGMPLVWVSRLHGQATTERVYGPDLLLALCEHGMALGYRHYFYGGAEGVAEILVERLHSRFPELQVAGLYSPPFRTLTSEEESNIIDRINATNPTIVWVGLGAPKQERWMAANLLNLSAPVLIGVGAAFDFHAGLKPQAPRWMQRSGLEWLFRLSTEPKRLWKRYLINNPRFVYHVLMQTVGLRQYDV